jgi:hypothetical protein
MHTKASIIVLYFCINLTAWAQTTSGKSNPILVDYSQTSAEVMSKRVQPLGISSVPTYRALIIGISDYKYSGPKLIDLDEPVNDAESLYAILTDKYAFETENTKLLKNPTREKIINAFDSLIGISTEKDNLLVFYAGHGEYDKSTEFGFWLPSNAKSTSRADWIANSTIKDYVQAIPSKHTLLITDACFGGSIFKTRASGSMDLLKIHEMYKYKSRKAMTSGNLSAVPDKSFFIDFLLKTLKENEEDVLPASALFSRIYEPVLNNSPTIPQFGIIQSAGDEGGDFLFIRCVEE